MQFCVKRKITIIYTNVTKGTSSPILRRSEEDRIKLCDMKTNRMYDNVNLIIV